MDQVDQASARRRWRNNRFVADLGGIVDPTSRDPDQARHAAFVADVYARMSEILDACGAVEGLNELPLFLVAAHSPNAALLGPSSEACILVNQGLLREIERTALAAVSCHDFMSSRMPWTAAAGLSDERREFATHLVAHMLDFVVSHEIAHDVRGHLAIVEAERGMAALDEITSLSGADAGDDLLRFLEFDADVHALDIQMHAADALGAFADDAPGGVEGDFFIHLLAMLLVFQILDAEHRPVEAADAASHPAPIHRALFLSDVMVRSFADASGLTEESLVELHDEVWFEASIVARGLRLPEGRWHGAHMDDAHRERLEALRPRIVAFSKSLD